MSNPVPSLAEIFEDIDMAAIPLPEDKVLECEFFLQLMATETNRDRFRWLMSAFLNAVYSFYETAAVTARYRFTDEDGTPRWDTTAREALETRVGINDQSDKKSGHIKTFSRKGTALNVIMEHRNKSTHRTSLAIRICGENLPEDFQVGFQIGTSTPALAMCHQAMKEVRAMWSAIEG